MSSIGQVRDIPMKSTNGNTALSQWRVCILGQAIMELFAPLLSCWHACLRHTRRKKWRGRGNCHRHSSLKHQWNFKNANGFDPNFHYSEQGQLQQPLGIKCLKAKICVEHRKPCLWQYILFSLWMSTHRCVSLFIYPWEIEFFPDQRQKLDEDSLKFETLAQCLHEMGAQDKLNF